MQELKKIAVNIQNKIDNSHSILIVSSAPVDDDTLATSLCLKWWLKKLNKTKVEIVTFSFIPDYFKNRITGIEDISYKKSEDINFDLYDLVILVDSNAWKQSLGKEHKNVLEKINLDKIIHIDHHPEAEIKRDLDNYSLTVSDACTAKVLYDYFIKPSDMQITSEVADWIYSALIYDTYRFMHSVFEDTFEFANEMIRLGANHDKATDMIIPKEQIDYLSWALNKLMYFPEIKTTILCVYSNDFDELTTKLGKNWQFKRTSYYFMETIPRKIEGYDYHITFTANFKKDPSAIMGYWRTRNYGEHISIQEVMESLGFKAGGHFGAGGFSKSNSSIDTEKEAFINEMKKRQINN